MQIIQTIRDKGAVVVIAVIALSLIGFLLMDAKSGNKGAGGFLSSLNSNSVGKVNGTSIEKGDFDKKFKITEIMAKDQAQRTGRVPEASQLRKQVWDQMVFEEVLFGEAQKLGLDFTGKELYATLASSDQSNPLMQNQNFVDPATGKIDPSKVPQVVANIKKLKGDQADYRDAQLIDPAKLSSIYYKYVALLNASAYYPSWMQEKDNAASKEFANISYVTVPYNSIADSTIKVSDEEISSYVSAHKNLFKQDAGRMISYVTFSQLPNGDDSAKVKETLENLKAGFTTENNTPAFLIRNSSAIEYDSAYLPKSKIRSSKIDSIAKQPIGSVYGPYVDGGNYVLAKFLGSKTMPDSVKARHILIATVDPKTGSPIIEDSVAKKQADSIFTAIKGGADFVKLAVQFSSDGSKDKGGDLGTFGYGAMVPEFNDFCFEKTTGSKAVVKTQFGYHIIEIMNQKGNSPAYKIAFMAKPIIANDPTIQEANNNATKLSGQKSGKELDDYIAKNGLHKITWPQIIKENDFQLGQIQDARLLIKWAFDAKQGDVSEPFNFKDQFVVATLDKIQEEGTQDVRTARPMAEVAVRNQKKAATIIKTLGTNATVESAATAYKQEVKTAGADSSITFNSPIIPNIGAEPKLIGASFNKDNQAKASAPIEGANGVYIIKVNSINTKPADTPELAAQKANQQAANMRTQAGAGWFDSLKAQATITDNRSKYY